jgi:hypothetical protein
MSGGESSINNGILNDRAIINLCKLAGTSNNAGLSNNGTKVDPLGDSHIHNGSLKDKSHIKSKHADMLNDDVMPTEMSKHPAMPIDSGMLTDGIEPLPPPEPPPLIFTPEKLISCTFLMEKQEDGQKLIGQVIVSKGSQYDIKMEWENGEIPNKPLRVISDYFVHITQYVYCHKPDVYCDFVYSDIPAICDGSTANRRRHIWDPGSMQNIDTASIMNEKATFRAKGE